MTKERANIEVLLTPRASRDEIAGRRHGALLVRVTAPPVEKRANEALCRLIARELGVAKGRVRIVRGARARRKLVAVEGVDEGALRRLGA